MAISLRMSTFVAVVAVGLLAACRNADAQTTDLTALSVEDLLDIEVTSVSRKEQALARTAAAVYVLTQDDIRRSGAKTLPELLRLVPGYSVARADASTSAVSARGFSGIYANKLLVLVDGRSVYSPMFAGVYWEMQTPLLSNIERIEVIRGPGGTLWGANAVNGVVNIITRPADATQGTFASASVGTEQRGAAEVRYGGRAGEHAYYSLAGKFADRRAAAIDGLDPSAVRVERGDARFDWRSDTHRVSVQGALQTVASERLYAQADVDQPVARAHHDALDGHALVAWTRSPSSRAQTDVQVYFQRYRGERHAVEERWSVVDVEVRQRRAMRRHDIVGGIGFRHSRLVADSVGDIWVVDPRRHERQFTAFLQDEVELHPAFRVTPGAKLEYNGYVGLEAQPSLRTTWLLGQHQAVWGAVSRAVRTPSVADRDVRYMHAAPGPGGAVIVSELAGNRALVSETLDAYEIGYRLQAGAVSVDVTGFRNFYDDLIAAQPGAPAMSLERERPVIRVAARFNNVMEATASGAETAVSWHPVRRWKLSASTAWLRVNAAAYPDAPGVTLSADSAAPAHHVNVRTYVDLPGRLEASALFFGAAALDELGIAARHTLDLRVSRRVRRHLEVAVGVQNLFAADGPEFVDTGTTLLSVPVRPSGLVDVIWRF